MERDNTAAINGRQFRSENEIILVVFLNNASVTIEILMG